MTKQIKSLIAGTTLSSLFFYPLISGLSDEIWFLQWSLRNSLELATAFFLLSVFLCFASYGILRIKNDTLKVLMVLGVSCIPVLSFLTQVARQADLSDFLKNSGEFLSTHSVLLYPLGLISLFSVIILYRYKRGILHASKICMYILAFINIPTFLVIFQAGLHSHPTLKIPWNHQQRSFPQATLPKDNIIIILFDELSYRYLYSNGMIKKKYPRFAEFSSQSTNYHRATAAGASTIPTIPRMLSGTKDPRIILPKKGVLLLRDENDKEEIFKFKKGNFFDLARAKGYQTIAFGNHLPYCEMLETYLDRCWSYSIYNYGTIYDRFSLLNPILTNLILWPQQFPTGLIKRPLYNDWQRRGTKKTVQLTLNSLQREQAMAIFSHINVPHVPFVFDAEGYNPVGNTFLENEENYIRQLGYVDKVLGIILDELKRLDKYDKSTIIVQSDHDYRKLTPSVRHNEIPLLIKMAGQKARQDIYENVSASEMMYTLVQ